MRIEQLMTKDAAACGPDEDLGRAAQIMWERDCGFVPVTERDGRLVGVVTDRDACMASYTQGQALKGIPIRDVMSREIRTCGPDDDVQKAEATMRTAQVHRLPVVDEAGQLLGVISLADIAREAAREVGRKQTEVTEKQVGATLSAIRQPREIAARA